ncbi:MAG: chemotaxis protein CheW [Elainella sp. Prado103]|nr:chemotaxis protein CheW [Elainella sp. Prado103]
MPDSTMLSAQPSPLPISSSSRKSGQPAKGKGTFQVKLITFEIGKLRFAVRIDQVQKVVNLPKVYGSGLRPIGLTQVGDQEVTVLDLGRRLFLSPGESTGTTDYLVLVQSAQGEVMGIPVADTPLLVEIASEQIRVLPESYRRADTLEFASHIIVVPHEAGAQTLFLLDIESLHAG